MCRKNWVSAAALIGFGAGLLAAGLFGSELLRLVVGLAAISVGVWLLRGRC